MAQEIASKRQENASERQSQKQSGRQPQEQSEKQSAIAIDFAMEYSQVSFYVDGMKEPESFCLMTGGQNYLIPTLVAKKDGEDRWYVGNHAKELMEKGEASGTRKLYECLREGLEVTIGEAVYEAEKIFAVYVKKILDTVSLAADVTEFSQVIITVRVPEKNMIENIYKAVESLGYDRSRIHVIGHAESFIYYNLFQKRELWANDVIAFDFSKDASIMYRMTLVRARAPQPVIVKEDSNISMSFELLATGEGRKELDRNFKTILEETSKKGIVTTIYLTGAGFQENWMDESKAPLCNKHRVFQGSNLFVKGAGYAGMVYLGKADVGRYMFVCSGRTILQVDVDTLVNDTVTPLCLSKSGCNWYDAGARLEAILDDTKELHFTIHSLLHNRNKNVVVTLSSLPERPNKTTRVEIVLSYLDDKTIVIRVTDLGFGDFYPATGQFEQVTINVEECM